MNAYPARASIAALLAFVALAGLGLAALRVSSRLWANVSFSLALMALVASIAGLIYLRGSGRAACAGFALFGWTYFLVALGPPPLNALRDSLVTAPLLAILEERLLDDPDPTLQSKLRAVTNPGRRKATSYAELTPWTFWTATDRANLFSSDSFHRIGYSLCTLGVAMAGGAFCRLLHDTRRPQGPTP